MTSELDMYRSAHLLIKQFGNAASFHAAQRADELLDQGDVDGAAVWRGVLEAVRELAVTKLAYRRLAH